MLVDEENETFFIRVWKRLLSTYVLENLRRSPKGKVQRTIFASGVSSFPSVFSNVFNSY